MSQNRVSISYSNTALQEVIVDLEVKFHIKFSFNSDIISNQQVTISLDDTTLQEVLFAVERQANITFKKETERYYTIKAKPKSSLTDVQHLQEVLIQEYLVSGISKQANGTSISLFPNKLGILPGLTEPDVLQSIQLLPGVQSPTETASDLFIRGGTPDQNLILWDGIKMYNTGHFFGTISAFNPYITDEIKLYKNGIHARYGNRISGVIDITSANTIPKTTNGGFGFNMTHADAFLKVPLTTKVAVMVSARRSITDVVDTETFKSLSKRVFQETKISEGNKVFEDDEVTTTKAIFNFRDYTAKVIIKPNEDNTILVSNLFTQNKLDYGFLIEAYNEASQDQLDIKNSGTSIIWRHNYNQSLSHSVEAYYSDFNLDYMGSNSIPNEFSDRLEKRNRVDDIGFSYHANNVFNERNSLGFGYQFAYNKVNYGLSFQDSESPEDNFNQFSTAINNSHVLYSEYKHQETNKWLVKAGARANYFSSLDKLFIEPRFQFETKWGKYLSFQISGETLHQTVSQVVEFNTQEFGLENQIWILSDGKNFPVLKSLQLASGISYIKQGWNIDVEGYYKNIKGLTSYTFGFDNIEAFFSKGESDVFGLDVLIKKRIDNYRTWLSYSCINNNFKFANLNNGRSFPGNSDITHHISWSHTYNWKQFNVSLGWILRTGTPYTYAKGLINTNEGTVIDFADINGRRLPFYDRLDISTTYTFNFSKDKTWKGKLGASILNVYDKKNILSRKYEIKQNTEGNPSLREINKVSLGFTPNLVFRIEF